MLFIPPDSTRFADEKPKTHKVKLGRPFTVRCDIPPAVPKPKVWWIYKSSREETGYTDFDSINATHISGDDEVR